MSVFDRMDEHEHEQLVFWSEPRLGYRGIIAIHDTTLGPALGGTRVWGYATEEDAVIDALRLSRGMTYKAAIAGLALGGGKSVIIGDPKMRRREMVFRAHGRAVKSLGGRYITAEDVGTSPEDMEFVHLETEHVAGLHGRSGDPSPVTAFGVFQGIRAAAKHRFGDADLGGRHISVQGVGHVGLHLCRLLHEDGARLTVTDIDQERVANAVEEFGAETVEGDGIFDVDADIFAPCALGAVINDDTVDRLRVEIVAGAANNQLATDAHGDRLCERDILYAPDYVVNAGGLVNVYGEINGWSSERARRKAGEIHETLLRVFELADEMDVSPSEAADQVAEDRIDQVRHLHRSLV